MALPDCLWPGLVYFGGATDRTVVSLDGSSHHVLGSPPVAADGLVLARSMTPALLDGIGRGVVDTVCEDDAALAMVRDATAALRGPTQNVEFVAKRLLYGSVGDQAVLLGSPLYVTLVD